MAHGGDPPAGPYEWDAWISFRSNEFGAASAVRTRSVHTATVSPCSVRLGCWETATDLAGTLALGNDEELAIQLYTALSAKSWRVFYAPVCLPPKTKFNTKEWELKYLHACANSGR